MIKMSEEHPIKFREVCDKCGGYLIDNCYCSKCNLYHTLLVIGGKNE